MIAYDRRIFKGLPEVDKIDVQRGVSLLDDVPQSEDLIYASQASCKSCLPLSQPGVNNCINSAEKNLK